MTTIQTQAHWPDSWPQLEIDVNNDGNVVLTRRDPFQNDNDVVIVHPAQVQHLATRLGLLPPSGDGGSTLWREIRTLRRRLRIAAERVDRLHGLLAHCGSHEDLTLEQAICTATSEMLDDWVSELEDDGEPDPGIAPPSPSPSPADGKPNGTVMANAMPAQLDLMQASEVKK